MTVLAIFMFKSQLMQMPGPRDIVIYRPHPRAFSIVQKPWGWAHISVQKPRGARGDGNRSNWYLHYSSVLILSHIFTLTVDVDNSLCGFGDTHQQIVLPKFRENPTLQRGVDLISGAGGQQN